LPEPALEYSIAAGDVETVADLVGRLVLPTYQQGRVSTVQRWFRWLHERGGIGKHLRAAALASVVSAVTGRPAEAERWADVVDQWQFGGAARSGDPPAEAWAALVRAVLCRGGVMQMRADADEAARRFTAEGIKAPIGALCQGLARILSGDLDGGDVSFADAVNIATEANAPEGLAEALSEQALLAIARNEWSRAAVLADRALSALRQAGIEDSYATTLVCAVAARVALHHGDIQTARQRLISAQRTRSLLTYAMPHMAVQARIELIRVHLALGDLAGARTLMQEVNELLGHRPDLGNLVGEAQALRDRLANESGSGAPGASSLTAAELRLLPILSTHLSFAEIAAEMSLSRHTINSQAMSIYRKLGAGSRSQAVARSRELGLLEGDAFFT
jgi:LuxR family maltose regulon positive regulatory protein